MWWWCNNDLLLSSKARGYLASCPGCRELYHCSQALNNYRQFVTMTEPNRVEVAEPETARAVMNCKEREDLSTVSLEINITTPMKCNWKKCQLKNVNYWQMRQSETLRTTDIGGQLYLLSGSLSVKYTKHSFIRLKKKFLLQCRPQGGEAATAAALLQSCPTLCDPIDGSPSGSPIPGILQARTLEWVAISLSSA